MSSPAPLPVPGPRPPSEPVWPLDRVPRRNDLPGACFRDLKVFWPQRAAVGHVLVEEVGFRDDFDKGERWMGWTWRLGCVCGWHAHGFWSGPQDLVEGAVRAFAREHFLRGEPEL